ncbi:MAG: ABC transporter ATP-binding protein [Burkholderiales bacterium]
MIQIENLTKTFGRKTAVDNLSFTVERGEVLGFLGPNGAGKSTTMRMITGFYPPSAGRIRVGGADVTEEPLKTKAMIGYLPENAAAYADMSVHGFLDFAAEMRGISGDARKRAIGRVVELCFLQSVLHQSIDTLSKGYRHRTCLAQSLIHEPDVLIMDEPTDGLDPNQKHEVRTLIREIGKTKAVVFSTHILEEVDAACTRAIIIDRGRMVANGTPSELKARSELAGAVTLSADGVGADALGEKLGALAEAARWERVGDAAVRAYPAAGAQATLVRAVVSLAEREHWRLSQLSTDEGALDQVFRSLTLPDTVKK